MTWNRDRKFRRSPANPSRLLLETGPRFLLFIVSFIAPICTEKSVCQQRCPALWAREGTQTLSLPQEGASH